MTMKPFEIQGAELVLGGVQLQAGTTGVVIPGVTQAANFRVEEVEDTDDQTHQFATDSEVVVVDAALYNAIVAQGDEGHFADFTATTDGEGYIDEIEVNGQGTYTQQESSTASGSDMYAYIGSSDAADRPLIPEDWIQIPFRPKMRAGEVENIGQGGGASTGDITFDGVDIIGDGSMRLIPNINSDFVGNGQYIQIYPTINQDAPHIHIAAGEGGDLLIGTDNSYVDVNHDGTVKVQADGGKQWQFDTAGKLHLPEGGDIVDSNGVSVLGGAGGETLLPSYKGFRAHYGSMYDNNSDNNGPINKLVIYKDTVTPASTISSDTDVDEFTVTGLTGSDVVAMLVVISDNVTQTPVEDLKTFVEAVIDNVVLYDGVEGDVRNIDDMKSAFYDNFTNFNSIIGSVDTNFNFYDTNALNYSITDYGQAVNSGSGSGLNLYSIRWNPDNNTFDMSSGGVGGPGGYQVNDTITIPGTVVQDYQGNYLSSPSNDITVTITSIDGQGTAQGYTITGTVPYTTPTFPVNSIEDGGNDEYDTGNYINTDIESSISYNNGDVATESSAFGNGNYVVTYQSGIFGLFVTNANIDVIGTGGSSGFDGSGASVTGGLYGGDTPAASAIINWTNPDSSNTWRIETYNGGSYVYYDGGSGVQWFDVSNSTSGANDFRGAIIEYHAYVNNGGTIIGTIHLASDNYNGNSVTHTEHMSGSGFLTQCVLWQRGDSNYQLLFKTISGNSSGLSIQWTAKVFYGQDFWD